MAEGILEELLITLKRIADTLEAIHQELQRYNQQPVSQNTITAAAPPSEEIAQEPLPEDEGQILRQWMEARGFHVQTYRILSAQPEPWDWFALFLGERFDHLREFYEKWKRSLNTQHPFTLSLQNAEPKHISNVVQYANQLKAASLIQDYLYRRSTRTLYVTPAVSPDIINFVTGGWLERYVGQQIWRRALALGMSRSRVHVFRNVQVVMPNRQDAEIDIFALFDGGKEALWIESKTGDYTNSVERWRVLNGYLKFPPTRAAILLLDVPGGYARELLVQRTGMQVLGFAQLPDFLDQVLQDMDLGQP